MSWSLASIICVFCSLSFASIAEGATVRDDFDAIAYNGGNCIRLGVADGSNDHTGLDRKVDLAEAATCSVAEELANFTAVDGTAFQTDATGDDDASYTRASLSIDAGNPNVTNPQLDINANAVWAVMFSVKMP